MLYWALTPSKSRCKQGLTLHGTCPFPEANMGLPRCTNQKCLIETATECSEPHLTQFPAPKSFPCPGTQSLPSQLPVTGKVL